MPVVTTDAPWPDEDDDANREVEEDSLATVDRLIDDDESSSDL
jgi:hypothetical protein